MTNKKVGITYRLMPCSREEYEGVRNMIIFYRDIIKRRFRINVYSFLKKNLRLTNSWNKLYKSYKFLKDEGINYKEYWQVVIDKFEPNIYKHPYPFIARASNYINLYERSLDDVKNESGGATSTHLSSRLHVNIKLIGRDLITLEKLKLSNKDLDDEEIMVNFLSFFTDTFLLSDVDLFIRLVKHPELFDTYFLDPKRKKEIKFLFNRLCYDAVEHDKILEYRKDIKSYIQRRIDSNKDIYSLNPIGFLIGIQNDLERVNYMTTEAVCK